ncbi:effector-associated domain EAD1-containing protein [Hyalangium sp.]|uniref:effector-associated domain EAD1-containing protein n=1 Tax=Hyalangium sp. TaxID=2028555 RepID=UPI002D73E6B7|nr:effector-associated domain EAD1-containing protein [Hyalangium sp.]HYH96088.1 effector-associated domain EAD1-containing protein [Hyalangium sp.]
MNEVLAACPSLPAEFAGLRRVARAADRLERLRTDPQADRALELLRTLVLVAPAQDAAAALKEEALGVLERGFAAASPSFVLSLANLDPAKLPAGGPPEKAIKDWIGRHAPRLPLEEVPTFLEMLSPGRAEHWWRRAMNAALSEGMVSSEPRWAKAALLWLGLPGAVEALRTLLPANDGVEKRLLEMTSGVEMPKIAVQQLRQQAAERRWSRLHAWAAMQELAAREALQAQRAFPGEPLAGLVLLVERLPGPAVVEEAVSTQDAQLTKLLGRRTAREPELIRPLDAKHPGWRTLWSAHVAEGGSTWPPDANREALGRGLLDAILDGDEPQSLVVALAEGLADAALRHPERAVLWTSLSAGGRTALLPWVASALVKLCEEGHAVSLPEPLLLDAVVSRARTTLLSARVLAVLLNWDVRLDEQEARRWIFRPKPSEWAPVAVALGQAVRARGWKHVASDLYELSKRSPELRPAADACQSLLSSWQRWLLSWGGTGSRSPELNIGPVVLRVAELGANLADDRLEDIWERAGGERKHLKSSGAPDVRWREAATLAQKGTLKGGLLALVRELLIDRPYNEELRELEKELRELERALTRNG